MAQLATRSLAKQVSLPALIPSRSRPIPKETLDPSFPRLIPRETLDPIAVPLPPSPSPSHTALLEEGESSQDGLDASLLTPGSGRHSLLPDVGDDEDEKKEDDEREGLPGDTLMPLPSSMSLGNPLAPIITLPSATEEDEDAVDGEDEDLISPLTSTRGPLTPILPSASEPSIASPTTPPDEPIPTQIDSIRPTENQSPPHSQKSQVGVPLKRNYSKWGRPPITTSEVSAPSTHTILLLLRISAENTVGAAKPLVEPEDNPENPRAGVRGASEPDGEEQGLARADDI